MRRWLVLLLLSLLPLGGWARPAAAQKPESELRVRAKAHFEQGLALLDERAWDAALAEFLRSRELYPTRAATVNAAVALRELGRQPEARELLEQLLKEFPELPEAERARIVREMSALDARIGRIRIVASESGASVSVAGRDHGTTPLAQPVRVSAGTHVLRVVKRGFVPFEQRVSVAGQQSIDVSVKLVPLQRFGRLRVRERTGSSAEVLIDGAAVGSAPWEGTLAPGTYAVALRGSGNLGSEPARAPVRADENTTLSLALVPLTSELRIEPFPATALVAIDGVTLGRGAWQGRLGAKRHRVEISAEGFLTQTAEISLRDGQTETLKVELERDPESLIGKEINPPGFFAAAGLGAVLTPSLGSEAASSCLRGCEESSALGGVVGLDLGYHLGSGAGLGIELGGMRATQHVRGERTVTLAAASEQPAIVQDELLVNTYLAGLFGELHRGEVWTWRLRLSAGATLVVAKDTQRSGQIGSDAIQPTASDAERAIFAHATAGAGVGYRLDRHWEVGAELRGTALLAVSDPPTWTNAVSVSGGSAVSFEDDALVGSVVFLPQLLLNVRYEFH